MIEVSHVFKRYRDVEAVTDVTFVAPRGEVTAFIGKNGAGKSTVLKMIAGVAIPDAGHVLIDGAPFADAARPGETLGVLLDAKLLPSRATARAFLSYVCDTQGLPRTLVVPALELAGLPEVGSRRIGTFSLGMRQRLGIAAACVARPRTFVFDEPVNGLDPAGIQWFRSFVKDAARNGATVLLSSHNMAELALVADRVVMIDEGRIIATGSVDKFTAGSSAEEVYVEGNDLDGLTRVFTHEGWKVTPHDGGALVVGADPLDVGRAAFASGIGLTHLSRSTRSLEETYFDLLDEKQRTS